MSLVTYKYELGTLLGILSKSDQMANHPRMTMNHELHQKLET